jgi:aspartate-alanine antiporter
MQVIYDFIHNLFSHSPVLAIALALTIGYLIGKIPFGNFRLGGVAGSLLAGVLVSQFGVSIDDTVKNLLFALFIFAVGYESGPQFFRSLGRKTLREVLLALIVAGTGFATVVVVSKIMGFDKGLAAGVAAGGMTQSAIMGVASDALSKMGLSADTLKEYTANIGVGYAVTYIFGTLGAIIVCANILPKFMGQKMKDAAVAAEAESSQAAALSADESYALHKLIGRVYKIENCAFENVGELEASCGELPITVEKVKRGGSFLDINPDLKLQTGDMTLLVGQRDALVQIAGHIGTEVTGPSDLNLVMKTQEVMVTSHELITLTLREIHGKMKDQIRHGVYVLSALRGGREIPITSEDHINHGDILRLYGSEEDIKKVVGMIGTPIVPSVKTDMVLAGIGIVIGLLIGMLTLKVGGIPLTLGSGGGALLSGLFFGWLKCKRPQLGGTIPSSASEFMKDFGLAGFVAIVGLDSGLQAISTIREQGLAILLGGLIVTLVPLLATMLIGRYLLGYKNASVFAGALSGARSANPAFGQVLNLSGNSVPTVPFAVTYALANVFLTLLGPLVAAIV